MKATIIAECCQNHNGKKDLLKKMIHKAAENGADYVKIQTIRSKELVFRERFENGISENGIIKAIIRPYQPEFERLAKLDLSLEDERWFVEECWRAGVAPMTTVFSRTGAREIKDLGYEAIKVASYDCASFPLLRELKNYWKNIYVSTGSTYNNEIETASKILQDVNATFLHCVTIYPTPMEELNLKRISFLRKFCQEVGYSDHSKPKETQLWASKISLALGASCIERHFTILDDYQTKDGPVSINPQELNELNKFAKLSRYDMMQQIKKRYPNWEIALGQGDRKMTHTEILNRDYYRGRFASLVDGIHIYNWEDINF
jgi:N,N'-diacetyllegionaminate synthase